MVSREPGDESSALPAGDVESPKVAAQTGGWVGRETAGGEGGAATDDLEDDPVWAWAREWAERLPDWSDEQWRRINAGLGYRVRGRGHGEAHEPS